MNTSVPILSAENIGRRAGDQWLIRGVSLQIRAGERWAIGGPTGAGKTVLLRSLALLDPIDEGELRWNGDPVAPDRIPAYRRSIVYLHQRPVLTQGTVADNLQLPFQLAQAAHKEFGRDAAVASLQQLGRKVTFLDKPSGELSGGEAQIVALLRAMQVNPLVLLLDEPTSALDEDACAAIEALVANWLNESPEERATLWVSHNPQQLEKVADHRLSLKQS